MPKGDDTRTAPPPHPPEPDGPRQVSKFEFNLLRILRFLVGHFPADQGLQLVRTAVSRPECLSGGAVELGQGRAEQFFFVERGDDDGNSHAANITGVLGFANGTIRRRRLNSIWFSVAIAFQIRI